MAAGLRVCQLSMSTLLLAVVNVDYMLTLFQKDILARHSAFPAGRSDIPQDVA